MILDAENQFSNAQLVTTGSENGIISENVLDLGAAGIDVGDGKPIVIEINIQTAMVGPSSDTLKVEVVTDDNAAMSSPTSVQTIGSFPANSAAGTKMFGRLVPSDSYERYLALRYTAVDNALTAGKVDAHVVLHPDKETVYVKGYTIS